MEAARTSSGEDNLAVLWSMLFFFAIMAPYIVCWTAGLGYLEQQRHNWLKAIYVLPFTGLLLLFMFDVWLFIEAFVVNPIKLALMLFGYDVKINIPTRDQFSYSRLKTLSELFLENTVQLSLQVSIWYSGQAEFLDLSHNDLVLAAGSAGLNILFQVYSLSLEASIYDKNFFDYALLIMEGNFAYTPYLDSIQSGERKTVDYTQDDYGTLHMSMESLSALRRALEAPDCQVKKILLGKTCKELKEHEKEFLWQVHDTCARHRIHLQEDLTEELIQTKGPAILRMAAKKGLFGTVTQILNLPGQQQVDPNASEASDGGLTALMYACRERHYFVVKKLLDIQHIMALNRPKVDLNVQDVHQKTALMHVAEADTLDIDFIRVLLEHPQSLNIRDNKGRTALAKLCLRRKDKVAIQAVRLMLNSREKNDLDINLEDEEGMTPLMHACRVGNGPIARLLTEFYKIHNKKKVYPIEMNKRDNIGRTALHYASMEGHYLIVQYLLVKEKKHGIEIVDINMQSFKEDGSCTALMFACDWDHEKVIDALIEKNCDLNIVDKFDRTALLRAVRGKQRVMVRLLLQKMHYHKIKLESKRDYLGKNIFDYAKENARMRAIFAIQLESYKLPEGDEDGIDYKIEKLVHWMQYHANDEKLEKILLLCDNDADLAEKRYDKVLDRYTQNGMIDDMETEQMVDELLLELYLEQRVQRYNLLRAPRSESNYQSLENLDSPAEDILDTDTANLSHIDIKHESFME